MSKMNNTIAIKLPVGDIPSKAIMKLKKMTGLSISQIKEAAKDDKYLISFEYTDTNGLALMNAIRRELADLGIHVRQFEDGVERSPELFDNIEKTHLEIESSEYPD